ncbi:MAG: hypothetical protein ACLPVY_00890 [Acidimicrobiia bacterium]
MPAIVADLGVRQVLLSTFYFCLFVVWVAFLVAAFASIFRGHDLSGGVKALWVVFVMVLPDIGLYVYRIANRGERHNAAARDLHP